MSNSTTMNPSDKNITSRIVMQKILASDAMEFLYKDSAEAVRSAFLSSHPDANEIRLNYKTRVGVRTGAYNEGIAEVLIGWQSTGLEIQDLDGNIWMPFKMLITSSITSAYSKSVEAFNERAECISRIGQLLSELHEMATSPVKVMMLTNEQRIARDTKRKYDASCKTLLELISSDKNSLRRNLRAGGRGRPIDRNRILSIDPGRYEVEINDGSKRRPRIRKYTLSVPENPNYLALLKRIS